MKICEHESCGRENYVWYPINDALFSEVRKHPFCMHCGELKNVSDDHPKKLGYWLNKVNMLKNDFNISQVQRRLITNELRELEDFDDMYGVTGSAQQQIFLSIILKYACLSKKDIDSWFDL